MPTGLEEVDMGSRTGGSEESRPSGGALEMSPPLHQWLGACMGPGWDPLLECLYLDKRLLKYKETVRGEK